MSDATSRPQATMFEPELELRAARGEGATREEPGAEQETAPRRELVREEPGTPEKITFEQGYEELKGIVARLDDPELPIHEMFEGFRRGKGLEKALRTYLREREGELAELEAGEDLTEFEVIAPSLRSEA